MPGFYVNAQKEIVCCLGSRRHDDPFGQTWHDCPREKWPPEPLKKDGFYRWSYVDGQIVAANIDELAAADARADRDKRLTELDRKELALTGRLRIARREAGYSGAAGALGAEGAAANAPEKTTPQIIALEAELASLDTTKQALRDLPQSSGWPHKIIWPIYNG